MRALPLSSRSGHPFVRLSAQIRRDHGRVGLDLGRLALADLDAEIQSNPAVIAAYLGTEADEGMAAAA